MNQETTIQEQRTEFINGLGLTLKANFVPWSQSRNKGETHRSLNWLVTLEKGRQSMTIEYMQGIAHIPGYKHGWGPKTYDQRRQEDAYRQTCETGKLYKLMPGIDMYLPTKATLPAPTLEEILWCLVMDSSVLDYGTYEEWGRELGYDEDSRKGEKVYRDCLQQALQFNQLAGHETIEKLGELYQDY